MTRFLVDTHAFGNCDKNYPSQVSANSLGFPNANYSMRVMPILTHCVYRLIKNVDYVGTKLNCKQFSEGLRLCMGLRIL